MEIWSPGRTLAYIEKQAILEALEFYRGNKTHTAAALGVALRTIHNKLEEYKNGVLPTEGGVHVEPAPKAAQEQPVPMREREEVQAVSPAKSPRRRPDHEKKGADSAGQPAPALAAAASE